MNDTNILLVLGFCTTLIAVMTPIIKLNTSITKLNITMENLIKKQSADHENLSERVTAHGRKIDELSEKIPGIEADVNALKEGRYGA